MSTTVEFPKWIRALRIITEAERDSIPRRNRWWRAFRRRCDAMMNLQVAIAKMPLRNEQQNRRILREAIIEVLKAKKLKMRRRG